MPLSSRLTLIALAVSLTAASASVAQDFPIEIPHALGTTKITAKPQRVATVAWANHEVPLALGIVPVGFARANFGDESGAGLLPWVKQRLDELGVAPPVLFDEGDGIDFEAVAATRPDVILGAYSGLRQADYDMLSRIAPTVAYPEAPWATDWREMIQLDSAGLDMSAEGNALIAKIEGEIRDVTAKYPELQGKTAMFITHLDTTDLSTVSFYTENDTRVKFFKDLGLASPQSVIAASNPGQFSGKVSAERIDIFDDVDILVTYGGAELMAAIKADPLMAHMPAVARDAVVLLPNGPIGTAANPTPLSISWVLDDYAALLAEAARKAQAPKAE